MILPHLPSKLCQHAHHTLTLPPSRTRALSLLHVIMRTASLAIISVRTRNQRSTADVVTLVKWPTMSCWQVDLTHSGVHLTDNLSDNTRTLTISRAGSGPDLHITRRVTSRLLIDASIAFTFVIHNTDLTPISRELYFHSLGQSSSQVMFCN